MHNEYTLGNSENEQKRLGIQAQLLYGGPHFLDIFLKNGIHVLDVGCGTGDITEYVAKRIGTGSVVGIDIDKAKIGSNRINNHTDNMKLLEGDVFDINFPDNTFDLIYTRFLLMHLADPMSALKEMIRVTRPGGVVVAHEGIHDAIWLRPAKAGFDDVLKAWKDEMKIRGQNHSIGLDLYSLFSQIMLREIDIKILPHAVLASHELFSLYIKNWLEHIPSLKNILRKRSHSTNIDIAAKELNSLDKNSFYLELTCVASGVKREVAL